MESFQVLCVAFHRNHLSEWINARDAGTVAFASSSRQGHVPFSGCRASCLLTAALEVV